MEKTMARAIYKRMEIGKEYTTTQLFNLLSEKEYYSFIPLELHGKDVRKVVSGEMWKVVKAGYARTFTKDETLPILRGVRHGTKPTSFETYKFRYWVRLK